MTTEYQYPCTLQWSACFPLIIAPFHVGLYDVISAVRCANRLRNAGYIKV